VIGVPDDYAVEPLRVLGVLLFYAAIFLIILRYKPRIEPEERPTFIAVGAVWAGSVFLANYLLYLAGAMSFLPWVNNFLHTFVWIGFCLTWLWLGIREDEPLWAQCVVFAFLSLIVKYCEQLLLGTWEQDNFFGLEGNGAYVLGWSLLDGTYPILTMVGVRLAARRVPGLIAT
jgi:hypothetical protein